MDLNEEKFQLIRYLLSKSLDESIEPAESQTLDELIVRDQEARRYYIEFLQVHTNLRRLHSEHAAAHDTEDNDLLDVQLWEKLARHELTAEAVETEMEEDVQPRVKLSPIIPERNRPNKFSVLAVAVSIAAMLIMMVYVHLMPAPKRVVATLTDSVGCQWADQGRVLQSGDDVLNESRVLQKGFVSIKFDSGAKVIIEGPARFQPLEADKMLLVSGKAFAAVPEQAIGFRIDTPHSSVVDLGTEFGVAVEPEGGSEVQVYKGKVNLVAGRASEPKVSEILQQHEARKVDAGNGAICSAKFKKYLFAQKISSKDNRIEYGKPVTLVSLTDLVMGGNGHGTSQETSQIYAVSTGQKITDPTGQYRTISNPYQPVSSNPFIDGIFVPDGKNQMISSQGHVFADCPDTSGFYYYNLCFDKNWRYVPSVMEVYQKQRNLNFTSDVVFMHSNIGVTFNLEAVRRQFPRRSIRRFQTTVGTLSFFRGYGILSEELLSPNYTEFDVWILVDGQLRSKAEMVHWDSLIDLDVPLTATDRFLSIAVTDGGIIRSVGNNANHYDLCGMADMRFEMESIE